MADIKREGKVHLPDWNCTKCGKLNYGSRRRETCFGCNAKRVTEVVAQVSKPPAPRPTSPPRPPSGPDHLAYLSIDEAEDLKQLWQGVVGLWSYGSDGCHYTCTVSVKQGYPYDYTEVTKDKFFVEILGAKLRFPKSRADWKLRDEDTINQIVTRIRDMSPVILTYKKTSGNSEKFDDEEHFAFPLRPDWYLSIQTFDRGW